MTTLADRVRSALRRGATAQEPVALRQVVLHLGSQKTGTTAVQAWCREHADALAAHGAVARTTQSEIRAALGGWYDTARDGADRALRAFLDDACRDAGVERLFYSSESNVGPAFVAGEPGLYPRLRAGLEGIERATAGTRRQVQFTVRSYAPFLESAYLQQLKHGRPLTFEQYTAGIDDGFSWRPVVQALVDVFGADDVVVYDYDAPRERPPLVGQVLTDALEALGAGAAVRGADWSHRTNPRYTQRMADLALAVLPLLRTDSERKAFHRFCTQVVARSPASADDAPATFVGAAHAEASAARYADDLAWARSVVEVR